MPVGCTSFGTLSSIALYRQQVKQASFTIASNAAASTLFTVSAASGDSVIIESVTIRTTTVSADLTSITVTAFASDYVEFISAVAGDAANLNQIGKQVSWEGVVELPASTVIRIDPAGTAATNYSFVCTVKYRNACPAGTGSLS